MSIVISKEEIEIIPPDENYLCKDCIYCKEKDVAYLAGECENSFCEYYREDVDGTQEICIEAIINNER